MQVQKRSETAVDSCSTAGSASKGEAGSIEEYHDIHREGQLFRSAAATGAASLKNSATVVTMESEKDQDSENQARCGGCNRQLDATKWMRYCGSIVAVLRGIHENVIRWQPQRRMPPCIRVGSRPSLRKLCATEFATAGSTARSGKAHCSAMTTLQFGSATVKQIIVVKMDGGDSVEAAKQS